MNKKDLVDVVADATGATKADAGAVVDAVFDAITAAMVSRDKVAIAGFGTFEARHRAAREARNPQTGATVSVAAHHAPAFKAGKALKDAVR